MSDDLVLAAFDGDAQLVLRLLDAGADINAEGRVWNPLHAAIENENVSCVQLLIDRGADIERSYRGMTPLAHAIDIAIDCTKQRGGKPGDEPTEVIDLLLAAGADPASGWETAQAYRSAKMVELLTNSGKGPFTRR